MYSKSPVYNLSAVLKETGMKADILRAWERRYNFPVPQRTPGGHRLYSEYDIATLKWLRARQAEGLSISRAVELWHSLLAEGGNPLVESAHSPAVSEQRRVLETQMDDLRSRWLEACLAFNGEWAEAILNQAFSLYPVEMVCSQLLQKGLQLLGRDWSLGKTTVQQEHFATALAQSRLASLISATPAPTRIQTVLLACPPGEWHAFPLLLLNLYLRRQGLPVVYLGANVPLEQMAQTAASIQPRLVVMSAQQFVSAAALKAVAQELSAQGFHVGFGGLVFNQASELQRSIAGHFLGESLEESLAQIEHLLASKLQPFNTAAPEGNALLAGIMREKHSRIEHAAALQLQQTRTSADGEETLSFITSQLQAALELGALSLLQHNPEWVIRLQPELLDGLVAVRQAVGAELGPAGEPIQRFLDETHAFILNKQNLRR